MSRNVKNIVPFEIPLRCQVATSPDALRCIRSFRVFPLALRCTCPCSTNKTRDGNARDLLVPGRATAASPAAMAAAGSASTGAMALRMRGAEWSRR